MQVAYFFYGFSLGKLNEFLLREEFADRITPDRAALLLNKHNADKEVEGITKRELVNKLILELSYENDASMDLLDLVLGEYSGNCVAPARIQCDHNDCFLAIGSTIHKFIEWRSWDVTLDGEEVRSPGTGLEVPEVDLHEWEANLKRVCDCYGIHESWAGGTREPISGIQPHFYVKMEGRIFACFYGIFITEADVERIYRTLRDPHAAQVLDQGAREELLQEYPTFNSVDDDFDYFADYYGDIGLSVHLRPSELYSYSKIYELYYPRDPESIPIRPTAEAEWAAQLKAVCEEYNLPWTTPTFHLELIDIYFDLE